MSDKKLSEITYTQIISMIACTILLIIYITLVTWVL
ncbi:uncharacterized protein METZ01_LOCUS142713 [marine metagenome]|uniref:Uncharacterized protein n=1 Tax=marine metagenome TaxID=408172 RepID=A0A381ZL03_9ZZZZ